MPLNLKKYLEERRELIDSRLEMALPADNMAMARTAHMLFVAFIEGLSLE